MGLISIMKDLNLEFKHEEITQADLLFKIQNKTDKQIIILFNEDYLEIKNNLTGGWAENTRVVIMKKIDDIIPLNDSIEIIKIDQTEKVLKNQLVNIFKSLKDSGNGDGLIETLSEREKIIMRELVLGYTNKEIADRLFISPHTVIAHRKNITGKLGIKSVPGLTIYAILHKIISEEDIKRASQPSDSDTHK